ncbi:MAG TPA: choice-of-anchor tandem repeat NxxGxxAF-containing protein [Verrucomicrobiae bacterium]|jgi:hypothetical protein
MKRNSTLWSIVVVQAVLLQALTGTVSHAGNIIKLAESGDFEPGSTNNVYSEISESPTLNDAGQVSFNSDLRDSGFLQGYGIYLADGKSVTTVAHVGQPMPDLNGNFYSFYDLVALNSTSQVFQANLRGTLGGGDDDTGIYQFNSGGLTQLAREGYATPDGNGIFKSLDNVPVRINRSGQTAFSCTTTSPKQVYVIYRSTDAVLTVMAFAKEASPDGNGQLYSFSDPALNNNGEVAFYSSLLSTNGSTEGFFKSDGNAVTVLARYGQIVPNGNGTFSSFRETTPAFNDNGQIAFESALGGTTGGSTDNAGLYRSDGVTMTEVARKGQFVPGGNGRFLDFGNTDVVAINNRGQVAFFADLTGTTGGTGDNAAICLADGASIIQVVRKGQAAPDGNGVFSGFGYPSINNKGQVAFTATLTGTSRGTLDNQGIFLADPSLGILQVVRSGLMVGGETLSNPEFLYGPNFGGLTGLNDNGQMAFWAGLNGNYAVFLWSLPEIISVARVSNDVLVTVQAVGGTTNYVQATSTLGSSFTDIASVVLPGSGLVTTNVLDTGGATNTGRYYRIRQLP